MAPHRISPNHFQCQKCCTELDKVVGLHSYSVLRSEISLDIKCDDRYFQYQKVLNCPGIVHGRMCRHHITSRHDYGLAICLEQISKQCVIWTKKFRFFVLAMKIIGVCHFLHSAVYFSNTQVSYTDFTLLF